jgi:cytoskeletal protein RodZ
MADCAVGFDARWHSEIEETVNGHDVAIRGNGTPGLNQRMSKLEEWREDEIEQRKEFLKDRRDQRNMNRTQLLALAILVVMAIINASGIFTHVPQFSTQTTTSTTDSSTTTHK